MKQQIDRVLSIESVDAGASGGYAYLCERAEAFVRARGVTDEAALVSYVFGTSANPGLWRPLLRTVLQGSRVLEELNDGAWRCKIATASSTSLASFVALDVETTGLGAVRNRIIEIGLIRYQDGQEIERFSSLCQPDRRIPVFISRLTGITDRDLAAAPRFTEIAKEVIVFIGDAPIAGHNVGFDLSFLSAELRRIGQPPLINESIDTMGLGMRLLAQVRRPSLDRLAQAVGLEPRNLHRAVDDADLTARILVKLLHRAAGQGAMDFQAVKALAQIPGRAPKDGVARGRALLDRSHLKDLPATPGVYIMRDVHDRVIYTGKAKCLKDRVRSYYSQPLGYTRKLDGLLESVQKIDIEETGSELSALLLESQLIRWHQPRFNTAQRSSEEYPYIRVDVANPWPRVTVSKSRRQDGARYFGPYRSNKTGRLIVELLNAVYPLRTCPRTFKNARSYGSPCLRLDLGQCLGPCAGNADRDAYMETVQQVIRFLEGDDASLIEQMQADLAETVERLDFERARLLRGHLRTVQAVAAAAQDLRSVENGGLTLLLSPGPGPGSRQLTLILKSQRWAVLTIAHGTKPRELASRTQRSVLRYHTFGIEPVDHASVDDSHILSRWLRKHEGAPFIREVEIGQLDDWSEIARWACRLAAEDLDPDRFLKMVAMENEDARAVDSDDVQAPDRPLADSLDDDGWA